MARLQDFQNVTPTSSDKILIVQSQGQGLAPHTIKLDSTNPTGTGSLSMNRASGTTGDYSTTLGYGNTASGVQSYAEGGATVASGAYSHAEGLYSEASGQGAHAEGRGAIANHRSQHVFGEYNTADASTAAATAKGNYIEIVGKGTSDANRSNARTLDWSGNEVLAGGLKVNGSDDVNKWETGTITFSEGVTNNGSTLKKCNGVVYLHIDCYVSTAITGRTMILTLPTGFRPTSSYERFIVGGSSSHGSALNRITTAFLTSSGGFTLGDVIMPSGTSIIDITADVSFPIS